MFSATSGANSDQLWSCLVTCDQRVVTSVVVLMPLRDRAGDNLGLVVYAFKVPVESNAGERVYYLKALNLRDALAKRIPRYETLFAPAK